MPFDFEAQLIRQQSLEDHMLSAGAKRFRDRLYSARESGRESLAGAARKLLHDAIQPTERGLQAMLDGARATRGRKHFAVHWLDKLTTQLRRELVDKKGRALTAKETTACETDAVAIAAYLTCRCVLNTMMMRLPAAKCAAELSENFCDELRYRRFREQAPGLYHYRTAQFTTTSYTHMARSLNAAVQYAEIDTRDITMERNVALLVGLKFMDVFAETTGLCTVEQGFHEQLGSVRRKAVRRELFLVPTGDTAEWIDHRNAALEFLRPLHMPMVVPPLAWSAGRRGGYRFALRNKYPFVRRGHEEAQHHDMPIVYAAVNRIQETAWRINPRVLALVQDIAERGGEMAGIPRTVPVELPVRPTDIATNKEARTIWRKRTGILKDAEHQRTIVAKDFLNTLSTALAVHHESCIWFPCNVDFRGRVYPLVNYLSPQGNDLSKSLLTFAQGRALGSHGADWLATHGANCLGETPDGVKLSRATLAERVEWIVKHTLDIEAVVRDPFAARWWMDADDPLQFYAFCVEWAEYATYHRQGRGEEYVSSLPCAMDGTCNGLQHFSAMLRDEVGGRAVNVVPQERPQDIYQQIAEGVMTRLEGMASDDEMARLWLTSDLVNRKLAKRPTMTFPYGSKKFGFRSQLIQFLRELETYPDIRRHFSDGDTKRDKKRIAQACSLMALLVWETICAELSGAARGMDWLQQVARSVAHNGTCVAWRVPGTDFLVRQGYMKVTTKQIKTMLAGKIVQPSVYTTTGKPNALKQANAVAPNFVHSLDAAALMLTVDMAAAEGVEAFAMVHDSYGTHAADCAVLAQCTREAFYRLYSRCDVLASFAEQVKGYCAEVPSVPDKGRLDLAGVLVSDYFFC